jgi:hypothetical protein
MDRVSGTGQGGRELGEIAFRAARSCVPLADEGDPHVPPCVTAAPSPSRAMARTSSTLMALAQAG